MELTIKTAQEYRGTEEQRRIAADEALRLQVLGIIAQCDELEFVES